MVANGFLDPNQLGDIRQQSTIDVGVKTLNLTVEYAFQLEAYI